MKRYFVAKTPVSGFVGLLPREDIAALLETNKITGEYVVTEATGPAYYLTYAQLSKRTDIQWKSVSQILTQEDLPEPLTPQTNAPTNVEGKHSSSLSTILVVFGIFMVAIKWCFIGDPMDGKMTWLTDRLLHYGCSHYAATRIDLTNSFIGISGITLLFGGVILILVRQESRK